MDARHFLWLLAGGEVLFAWAFLWNKLRIDWSVNEQYQYGWFVPPLALALLALRWADRPAPDAAPRFSGWTLAFLSGGLLVLLLPLRLIEEPNPDWRLLFWLHAGVLAVLSLSLAAWCGGRSWLRHFAFPVLFLLLAVPWPSGPEQAIVQSLMRWIAALSAEGMNCLGIPAHPEGNLVHIRDQWVGVDEACSGIRSLQTTLMAAFLLGELSRLSWPRRCALLGGGVCVAMIANVLRSSLLVWIAARDGSAEMERFHDTIGICVLVIVFIGLLWLNARLSRAKPSPSGAATAATARTATSSAAAHSPRPVPFWFLASAGLWLVAVEAGTASWYASAPSENEAALRHWTVAPPVTSPGYQNVKIDSRTRSLLRYDEGLSAHWRAPGDSAADCTLFFFRWAPGHASMAQAEMHQPHICLTASGLTQTADWGIEPLNLPNGISLPVRRYAFLLHGQPIYVFYIVWRDGAHDQAEPGAPGSRWERLRAVADRQPDLGRQTLEFIVDGQSTPEAAAVLFERAMAGIVQRQQ
jgi:exosortase